MLSTLANLVLCTTPPVVQTIKSTNPYSVGRASPYNLAGRIPYSAGGTILYGFGGTRPYGVRTFLTRKLRAMATSEERGGIRIYSNNRTDNVSDYLKEKYERDAHKYWDIFYKHNRDKFFKDRHYLQNHWGKYFRNSQLPETSDSPENNDFVLFEIGCGTGNTLYPLLSLYPSLSLHACDFSPRAVDLVKNHKDFDPLRVNAFVCDVTSQKVTDNVTSHSVDVVTMIFVLSAIAEEKMPAVLQNVAQVLKPGGFVLLRDYAVGDLAQERLSGKMQKIAENFYVRGDGTRAYYFSESFLTKLFESENFRLVEIRILSREIENRARDIVMKRRWIQATFQYLGEKDSNQNQKKTNFSTEKIVFSQESISESMEGKIDPKYEKENGKVLETERNVAVQLQNFGLNEEDKLEKKTKEGEELGVSTLFEIEPEFEIHEIQIKKRSIRIQSARKELQHTLQQTGLLLWDSAILLADFIDSVPLLVTGNSVLELGCGGGALSSLIVSTKAKRIVATDGNKPSLELLGTNLELNKARFPVERIERKVLEWGDEEGEREVVLVNGGERFDLILGSDVVYVAEAVPLLFKSAKKLLREGRERESESESVGNLPMLILCHVTRRVSEEEILEEAKRNGLRGCIFSVKKLIEKMFLKSNFAEKKWKVKEEKNSEASIGFEGPYGHLRLMFFTHSEN